MNKDYVLEVQFGTLCGRVLKDGRVELCQDWTNTQVVLTLSPEEAELLFGRAGRLIAKMSWERVYAPKLPEPSPAEAT